MATGRPLGLAPPSAQRLCCRHIMLPCPAPPPSRPSVHPGSPESVPSQAPSRTPASSRHRLHGRSQREQPRAPQLFSIQVLCRWQLRPSWGSGPGGQPGTPACGLLADLSAVLVGRPGPPPLSLSFPPCEIGWRRPPPGLSGGWSSVKPLAWWPARACPVQQRVVRGPRLALSPGTGPWSADIGSRSAALSRSRRCECRGGI